MGSERTSDSDWSRTYVSEDGVKQVGVYSEAVVVSLHKQVRSGQWVGLEGTGAIVSRCAFVRGRVRMSKRQCEGEG